MSEIPSPDEAGLTTGALARRLGVAPTTLRSWDRRYGIGPVVRDDGRHRRWRPGDVAVLEAMCRLTASGVPPADAARAAKEAIRRGRAGAAQPDPAGPDPGEAPPHTDPPHTNPADTDPAEADPAEADGAEAGPVGAAGRDRTAGGGRGPARADDALLLGVDVRQECRGLARAAVRLDAPGVADLLGAAVERHGLIVAWQEVMVPTLHAVGRKWVSSGDRYVEVEHLLSWHVSTVLRRAVRAAAPREAAGRPGPVLLACVPGEQHSLPLEALDAALGQLGVPTRMFGAAVPAEALDSAVRRLGPVAVVLWAQARSTASLPLARHIAQTRWGVAGARRAPVVVLGGSGWAGRPAPGLHRPAGLAEALTLLARVYDTA
ncbi:methanogenic corrinoid protein MtbC1 [Streptomyces sp. B4I13]|uniref:MerR family transcriptional regulator n=1 Tax=Streptomyces sp. B4I13 TaxID=3042271 RepID=UPI0027884262|nr:MerR family transcriptional regulator [Streptomyces sp. B4I13]MDQ0963969.1 methanogenic corrinoid protein MtbC1 [Streptomyces sp. B4I13]